MSPQPEAIIARHVATCRYEQLSEDAIAVAKRSIVDGLAVMVAGRGVEGMGALGTLVERWGGTPEARVYTTGRRVPAPAAAWVNGAHSRAVELDDCTDYVPIHPTAAAFPALLAFADLLPMSGKDFVRAIVVAQDLNVRFGLAIARNPMQSGRNDIYRVLAATAGAAVALELDEEATWNALGLSMVYGAGDLQGVLEGKTAAAVQYGNCAAAAVQSGLLAQLGATGAKAFLLGRGGYLTAFEPEHDLDKLVGGLGERFYGTHISVKPYAACRAVHAMIDMARSVRDTHGAMSADQIDRIDITVSPEVFNVVGHPRDAKLRPRTSGDAQFSAYFVAACALLHGRMGLADSSPSRLGDPRVAALAAKVHVHPSEAHRTDRIIGRTDFTVHTAAGDRIVESSDCPLGAPENPVSAEMLRAKLVDCFDHGGFEPESEDVDRLMDHVDNIEAVPIVRTIFEPFA